MTSGMLKMRNDMQEIQDGFKALGHLTNSGEGLSEMESEFMTSFTMKVKQSIQDST